MGLDAHELSEKTELPIKTVYAQTAELYRQYYVNYLDIPTKTRGRPTTITEEKNSSLRHRTKVVIEDTKGIYNIYDGKKSVPLPPGNVLYSEGFTDAWFTIVSEKEENELFQALLNFLKRALRRIKEADNESIRKWAPIEDMSMGEGKEKQTFCCSQCGLNHEARDFMRAMLLHLIDRLEENSNFVDFMKDE